MIVYHSVVSPPCRVVLLLLNAIGLKPEMKIMDLANNDTITPEFMAINPQHAVPVLVDGDFILTESRAIAVYLAEKYAPEKLYYPDDPNKKAIINQRLMFDVGTLFQRAHDVYIFGLQKGEYVKDDSFYIKMVEAVGMLEALLGDSPYMAGDEMTVADFSLISTISSIDVFGFDWTPYPNLKNWFYRCKNEMTDYDEINEKGVKLFAELIKKMIEDFF